MKKPDLALVALSNCDTPETEIDTGVHLRWSFRRELGFPLNGFKVYRRSARPPPIRCVWMREALVGKKGSKEVQIQVENDELLLSCTNPLIQMRQELRWVSGGVYKEIKIDEEQQQNGWVLIARAPVDILLPLTPLVLVDVIGTKGMRVHICGLGGNRIISETIVTCPTDRMVTPILLRTSGRLERIKISTEGDHPLKIVRICYGANEACDDNDGWECLSGKDTSICLPVAHPDYPCLSGDKCGIVTAESRLPSDHCTRKKYDGDNLDDLLETVRVVVDPAYGPTMGTRYSTTVSASTNASTRDSGNSGLRMSALDLLLSASIDPNIARLIGLYWVDSSHGTSGSAGKAARSFDYKIVGDWPEKTMWSLENVVGFDRIHKGNSLPPAFLHENLAFLANSNGIIVPAATNKFGAIQSLAFRANPVEWTSFFGNSSAGKRWVIVNFPEPVGEVQVYARQGRGSGLKVFASGGSSDETTNLEAVLAVHANGPQGIDMVTIEGDLQCLYQIHYGIDRIALGLRCFIQYGVQPTKSKRLLAPAGVSATQLGWGVTRKKDNEHPLLTGEIEDVRYPVGVRWRSPAPPSDTILSTEPLLFQIKRRREGGIEESCTGGLPRMISLSGEEASLDDRENTYFTDIVPQPGGYQYQVMGIDIFGRQSAFSPWSPVVPVKAPKPPPPTNVTAKWLDPKDPFITAGEKSWLQERKGGVLLRWEWNYLQARQSPHIEQFQLAFAHGWLNQLLGTIQKPPTRKEGKFTIPIQFEKALPANVLTGMVMSYRNVPYRILSHEKTSARAPFETELCCAVANSGVPAVKSGECVTISLNPSVHGKAKSVSVESDKTMRITMMTKELGAPPAAGFTGATLVAGRYTWPIQRGELSNIGTKETTLQVWVAPPSGRREIAVIRSLPKKTVTLRFVPSASIYINYRNYVKWPIRVIDHDEVGKERKKISVPAEGPGEYAVFVCEAEEAEPYGRTALELRKHRIVISQKLVKDKVLSYGQAAVASESFDEIGAMSSAATFMRVPREHPTEAATAAAPPPADDLTPIYASRPDYRGCSSYALRWKRTEDTWYIVHRALDETLFMVDKRVRPLRSKIRANWNDFLNKFTDPDGTLRDSAFETFVVRTTKPDYATLSNRLLQILASFPDVEEAFSRLHSEPIAWDNRHHHDRSTEMSDPDVPDYTPQASVLLYMDSTLPAQGSNRYFYRVCAIDALGNAAPMSISTPPVHLRLGRPQAPVITRVTGGERRITLAWASNRESNLKEYRVYRAGSADEVRKVAETDARGTSLQLRPEERIAVVPAASDPSTRPSEIVWPDEPVSGLTDFWYQVIAISHGDLFSNPSPIAQARAQQPPPSPPVVDPPVWDSDFFHLHLSWQGGDASAFAQVQRRPSESAAWQAVSDWLAPGTASFEDSPPAPSRTWDYRVRVKDNLGQQAFSASVTTPTTG